MDQKTYKLSSMLLPCFPFRPGITPLLMQLQQTGLCTLKPRKPNGNMFINFKLSCMHAVYWYFIMLYMVKIVLILSPSSFPLSKWGSVFFLCLFLLVFLFPFHFFTYRSNLKITNFITTPSLCNVMQPSPHLFPTSKSHL